MVTTKTIIPNKTGTIIVEVESGYDPRSVSMSGRTYDRILTGKKITKKGQGFYCDGSREQDYWQFNEKEPGSLNVYTDEGRGIYHGNINDSEVLIESDSNK